MEVIADQRKPKGNHDLLGLMLNDEDLKTVKHIIKQPSEETRR